MHRVWHGHPGRERRNRLMMSALMLLSQNLTGRSIIVHSWSGRVCCCNNRAFLPYCTDFHYCHYTEKDFVTYSRLRDAGGGGAE